MKLKIVFTLVSVVVFVGGCSYFRITPVICDNINPQDPNIPQECQVYDKAKADKAFDKVKDEKMVDDKDIIEYHKEKE